MKSQIDFDAITAASLHRIEELLHEWLPNGKRQGHEYKIGSLAGEPGKSLSVNLQTGVWKDFSSDAGGANPITLLAAIKGIKNGEAARIIADRLSVSSVEIIQAPKQKEEWIPLVSAPAGSLPSQSDLKHFKFGIPSVQYPYTGETGELLGIVCRWDLDSGKEILPISYCEKGGQFAWKWKSFAKPRPLFGLQELAERPDERVIVVEGEKAAIAARRFFPKSLVVTWPGGSKAVTYTNWMPLAEREVYLWPDNDAPGMSAMRDVAKILHDSLARVFIVSPPSDKPEGWDIADAESDGTSKEDLIFALKNAVEFEPISIPDEEFLEDEIHSDLEHEEPEQEEPFRILGHADGVYYYIRKSTQAIISLTASAHTKLELIALAPANYWEERFPTKQGADWFAAANSLIQRASAIDFSSEYIRGRGAWLDNDRVVFHSGRALCVDREEISLNSFASEYTYKKGAQLQADIVDPLSSEQANLLVKLLECLSFRNELDARLMAGWIALAPICGALEWRPHIWLTGPSGSGKSWILANIVRPLLGNCAVYFQSVSTAAGIRQSLGCDALPVVFDEAEVERESDQKRMQEVLILARQASRESDCRIVKGTASGNAIEYHIRSCFLFASIGLGATQRADLSRITSIDLLPESQRVGDRFEEAKKIQKQTMRDPKWASRFRARSVKLAAVIAQNSEVFKNAVLDKLGSPRDADQIGTLIAGAFSLYSEKPIKIEGAIEWCERQNWMSFLSGESERDEQKCLSMLFEANVIVQLNESSPRKITLMELAIYAIDSDPSSESGKVFRQALERFGIAVRKDGIDVANTHEEISKVFRGSQFAGRWADMLKRIPNAKSIPSTKILGLSKRAVRLPLSVLQPDS